MRTLAKTSTYFAMHLTVAIAVAYALSGDWAIALSIGVIEPAVQAGFFAMHERVWEGRRRRAASAPSLLPAGPFLPAARADRPAPPRCVSAAA